ncbi:MAG: VWA domain-containing protein [Candidatus Korarchaeota archaeon]|nr:VWA domain-containing protein [Candidatus Korarchaeota archaeon]
MTSLGLERPEALIAAPVALAALFALSRRAFDLMRSVESAMGSATPSRGRRLLIASLAARAALAVMIALLVSGPYVVKVERVPVTPDSPLLSRAEAQLVILVDLSRSMSYPMGAGTRIEAAREVVRGVLQSLSPGDLVTLVAFAGDAEVIYSGPAGEALQSLPELRADRNYTSIGDALVTALAATRASGRPAAVVLISDGGNNGGTDPVEAARSLREAGLPLLAVQVGQGVSADPAVTAELAREAGGEFRWIDEVDATALGSLAAEVAREAKYEALKAAGRAYVEVEVVDASEPRGALATAAALLLILALAGGA